MWIKKIVLTIWASFHIFIGKKCVFKLIRSLGFESGNKKNHVRIVVSKMSPTMRDYKLIKLQYKYQIINKKKKLKIICCGYYLKYLGYL